MGRWRDEPGAATAGSGRVCMMVTGWGGGASTAGRGVSRERSERGFLGGPQAEKMGYFNLILTILNV